MFANNEETLSTEQLMDYDNLKTCTLRPRIVRYEAYGAAPKVAASAATFAPSFHMPHFAAKHLAWPATLQSKVMMARLGITSYGVALGATRWTGCTSSRIQSCNLL